jgi:hypothetical protein
LWRAFGDERIKAVMPMMPEGFDLVGQRGMASARAAVLFVAGSVDDVNDYDPAAVSLFEHHAADRVSMVTFVGAGHFLILQEDGLAQIRRLATAFFDARLRGAADAADLPETEAQLRTGDSARALRHRGPADAVRDLGRSAPGYRARRPRTSSSQPGK